MSSAWTVLPVALSGFGVLALEVLYTRLFSLVFHNSTYTFGAVLAACLVALALGALVARVTARKVDPRPLVVGAAGVGGTATVLSVVVFVRVTGREYFRSGESFAAYVAGAFGLVALVVLLPVTALGAILPAVWHAGQSGGFGAGRRVGRTAVVNTLAAVFPDVSLWWGHLDARRPIVALVGGDVPKVSRDRAPCWGWAAPELHLMIAS